MAGYGQYGESHTGRSMAHGEGFERMHAHGFRRRKLS